MTVLSTFTFSGLNYRLTDGGWRRRTQEDSEVADDAGGCRRDMKIAVKREGGQRWRDLLQREADLLDRTSGEQPVPSLVRLLCTATIGRRFFLLLHPCSQLGGHPPLPPAATKRRRGIRPGSRRCMVVRAGDVPGGGGAEESGRGLTGYQPQQ